MLMGAHSFRTGAEYRRIRNGSVFATTKNGLILPNGVEELLTDGFFGDEADLALFGEPAPPDPMVEELRLMDVNALTPLEALNRLAEFKRRAEDRP